MCARVCAHAFVDVCVRGCAHAQLHHCRDVSEGSRDTFACEPRRAVFSLRSLTDEVRVLSVFMVQLWKFLDRVPTEAF